MSKNGKVERIVAIPDRQVKMIGSLEIPEGATGLVVFAHGSGSSRHSPRNNYVAKVLRSYGLGTLLLDLLTVAEDSDYEVRFDINLLAQRMLATTKWLQEQEDTKELTIGYFGASTGAAAALQTAAILGEQVTAIVSRGGRPDLAWPYLEKVKAPTLLMVGGNDGVVIELNQKAYDKIKAVKQIDIIPGATHLFEEPGTLERVAELAANWFVKYLIKK
ncbi:MAG: dienelactone hydrolase family protein [Acetobacterium sp.]